ncbi:unnamed protein product, partial [Rotaria magnacalcarata]
MKGTGLLLAISVLEHGPAVHVHEYVCVITIATGDPVAEELRGCQLIVPPRKCDPLTK